MLVSNEFTRRHMLGEINAELLIYHVILTLKPYELVVVTPALTTDTGRRYGPNGSAVCLTSAMRTFSVHTCTTPTLGSES